MFAALAAAAVCTAIPLSIGSAGADPLQLAQRDVEIGVGRPGVRVEEHRGPAVIEEHRRPGVVIEETEGRRRDCVTHSETRREGGVSVTEKERHC
jgi:hypothetical protein